MNEKKKLWEHISLGLYYLYFYYYFFLILLYSCYSWCMFCWSLFTLIHIMFLFGAWSDDIFRRICYRCRSKLHAMPPYIKLLMYESMLFEFRSHKRRKNIEWKGNWKSLMSFNGIDRKKETQVSYCILFDLIQL